MAEQPPEIALETKEDAGSVLQEYIRGEYKLSMWIPEEMAGKVVGKMGVMITNLQRETKASSIRAMQRVGDSLWTAVVIIGDWKPISAAYRAISDLVHGEVDDVVLEFTINYKKPFFLYGKQKDEQLRRLSARASVRIFMPDFDHKKMLYRDAEAVTLEGSMEQVTQAVLLLEEEAVAYQAAMSKRSAERDREEAAAAEKVRGPPATATASTGVEKPEERWSRAQEVPKVTILTAPAASREGKDGKDGKSSGAITNSAGAIAPVAASKKGPPALALLPSPPSASASASASAHPPIAPTLPTPTATPPPSTPAPAAAVAASSEAQVSRTVVIPDHIVGLFMSRRPPLKMSLLSQIQVVTGTVISRAPAAAPAASAAAAAAAAVVVAAVAEAAASRGANAKSDERSDPSSDDDSDEDSDEDSDDSDESDGDDDAEAVTAPAPAAAAAAAPQAASSTASSAAANPFVISGSEQGVAQAEGYILRIVRGERIRDVMEGMGMMSLGLGVGVAIGAKGTVGKASASGSRRGERDRGGEAASAREAGSREKGGRERSRGGRGRRSDKDKDKEKKDKDIDRHREKDKVVVLSVESGSKASASAGTDKEKGEGGKSAGGRGESTRGSRGGRSGGR
eukprot:gene37892-46030_t